MLCSYYLVHAEGRAFNLPPTPVVASKIGQKPLTRLSTPTLDHDAFASVEVYSAETRRHFNDKG